MSVCLSISQVLLKFEPRVYTQQKTCGSLTNVPESYAGSSNRCVLVCWPYYRPGLHVFDPSTPHPSLLFPLCISFSNPQHQTLHARWAQVWWWDMYPDGIPVWQQTRLQRHEWWDQLWWVASAWPASCDTVRCSMEDWLDVRRVPLL